MNSVVYTYCVNIAKWCDGNYDCGAEDETTCGGDKAYGKYRARNVFNTSTMDNVQCHANETS